MVVELGKRRYFDHKPYYYYTYALCAGEKRYPGNIIERVIDPSDQMEDEGDVLWPRPDTT